MALDLASQTQLDTVLTVLYQQNLTISTFFVSIFKHSAFTDHPSVHDLLQHCHHSDNIKLWRKFRPRKEPKMIQRSAVREQQASRAGNAVCVRA
jgi:hypothetical protein